MESVSAPSSNINQLNNPLINHHVFLTGRPPMGEFLGFVAGQVADRQSIDFGQLSEEWRQANDRVRELEVTEAGLADNVPIEPLPERLLPLADVVRNNPVFRKSFAIVPVEFGMIDLDRCVVFQKYINLDYVEELKARLGTAPTDEAIFQLCLPHDHPVAPISGGWTAENAFTFQSPSNDLRLLEAVALQPDQLSGYVPTGVMIAAIGLVVGFGSNFLNTFHVEGRLILGNGSHRAYALRSLGISKVPAIIQQVTRREELAVIANQEVTARMDLYLEAPRPPLLKDYFDEQLLKPVAVPKKSRHVKVMFGTDIADIPVS